MENLLVKIRRFIDFCVCLYYFPGAIRLTRLFKIRGLHSVIEKVFLYAVAKDIAIPGDILEIGSFAGSSSAILAQGNERSRNRGIVWLIEPDPQPTKEVFLKNFSDQGLDARIKLLDMTSQEARGFVSASFRLVFVDGNHEYEYVKKDIALWHDSVKPGGMMVFHDSDGPGVARAIDEFLRDSGTFRMLGTVCSMRYISNGDYPDSDFISRIAAMSMKREKLVSLARRVRLKK